MKEDTQHLIGRILLATAERDAIHIAVMPVVIDCDWAYPGQPLKFRFGSRELVYTVESDDGREVVGIVDPFISRDVLITKGSRVFMFLKPNTITGLRHQWTHPTIDNVEVPTSNSELWLRQFAERWNFNYGDMIREASAPSTKEWDNYIVAQGVYLHSRGELGDDEPLFWYHLGVITGKTFSEEHREKFGWTCSC